MTVGIHRQIYIDIYIDAALAFGSYVTNTSKQGSGGFSG